MSLRPTLNFLLYQWLDVESLSQRARFADHSRETFDAVLETCERIAREKYAPFNRLVDTQEPRLDGEQVILPQATHDAHKAYVESGMLGAAQDYELGGMQLPYTVNASANAVPFMQAFGHGVLAWIWLDVALVALEYDAGATNAATAGILGATGYFYHYELPKTGAWLRPVESRDMTCANLPEEAF